MTTKTREPLQAKDDSELFAKCDGWAASYISRNKWRVPWYMDFEDLQQEVRIKYLRCMELYNHTVPPHFMSLFQTSVFNLFIHIAKKHRREKTLTKQFATTEEAELLLGNAGTQDSDGTLLVLLNEAPEEARLFLLALSDEKSLAKLRKGHRRTHRGCRPSTRETTNQMFCRILGLDPSTTDLPGMLRDYFSS